MMNQKGMMMTRKNFLLPALAMLVLLGGCETSNIGTKQGVGTVGLLGNQFGGGTGKTIATVAGVLLGGWAGNEIGVSLDRADRGQMAQAQTQAYTAPVGRQIVWNNPESGNSGTIEPIRDGRDSATGSLCREYQTTVVIGGKRQAAYGQACQQSDGSWKVVK
jgi:surface antigen